MCGFILSCICFKGSYEDVSVNQSLPNITVNEGESAQITCCWKKTTETNKSLKVVWLKDEERIPEEKRLSQTSLEENCSVLNIIYTVTNDTGDYVCKAIEDIPVLMEYEGNRMMLYVNEIHTTTEECVYTVPSSTSKKPDVFHHPSAEDNKNQQEPQTKSSSRNIVMIYILRSLPFICLLMAFFYLNRDDKRNTVSKPADDDAVDSGGGQNEDLEVGETQMNETEEVKQGDKVSVQDEESGNTEKAEDTAATEDEKLEKETFLVVDTEKLNESQLKTEEDTHLMSEVEEERVTVL
ncbi:uncharacterized protein LOC130214271 [Danio aesculapii]|uniref:uncharacterized protein LOC130214271 n=1 Tax=Danio aesculapii TaxID=1142201 RepID=UPI0024BF284B|nr:uncharacterized protein LOC130214271 [Danio aesculapii]